MLNQTENSYSNYKLNIPCCSLSLRENELVCPQQSDSWTSSCITPSPKPLPHSDFTSALGMPYTSAVGNREVKGKAVSIETGVAILGKQAQDGLWDRNTVSCIPPTLQYNRTVEWKCMSKLPWHQKTVLEKSGLEFQSQRKLRCMNRPEGSTNDHKT